jgi:hypothetical protein
LKEILFGVGNKPLKIPRLPSPSKSLKMSVYLSLLGGRCSQEPPLGVLPVDDLPNLFHVVHTDVLVVDVVGVLPDIDGCMGVEVLSRGVRPTGASIYWLASSKTRRLLDALS